MKDEIKEILDKCTPFLFGDEVDKLLDYINNLQEENTKLKELCNKYEEEHKTTFIEWQKDIKANKKAIEEINKRSSKEVAKLYIDILKGDNK